MIEEAIITTTWTQREGALALVPQVAEEYPYVAWTDVTEQPPSTDPDYPNPNQYDIKFVTEDTVLDQIELDPNYTVQPGTRGPVDGPAPPDASKVPTQEEFDTYKAQQLAIVERDLGTPAWEQSQLDTAVGTIVDSRTWSGIVERSNVYKKNRPKRKEQNVILNARNQPPPPDGLVGYKRNGNGNLEPDSFNGNRIQQLWTNGIHFTVNLRDPILDVQNPAFRRIKIIKRDIETPDAFLFKDGQLFNNNTAIRWVTDFEFIPGERYRIRFVE